MVQPEAALSSRQAFIEGMSFAATTVNIVTTDGPAGRAGITVSAMSSVSADTARPSLLVCINASSAGAAPIRANGVFCVNVLRDDQARISDTFAGRTGRRGEERFGCADWAQGSTGAPMLSDALVAFDCRLTSEITVGSHHVLFGEVEQTRLARQGSPLIYASRAYGTPTRLAEQVVPPAATPSRGSVRLAVLNTLAPFFVPALLQAGRRALPGTAIDLLEGDQRQVMRWIDAGDAAVGVLYDVDLDGAFVTEELGTVRPHALLPAGHRLAEAKTVALAGLASEPLVLFDAPVSGGYFLSLFARVGATPQVAMRSASVEMVRSLVAHGHGCSLLVAKPANDMSYDGRQVATRALADDIDPVRLVLARTRGEPSRAVADVAALCRDFFRISKA